MFVQHALCNDKHFNWLSLCPSFPRISIFLALFAIALFWNSMFQLHLFVSKWIAISCECTCREGKLSVYIIYACAKYRCTITQSSSFNRFFYSLCPLSSAYLPGKTVHKENCVLTNNVWTNQFGINHWMFAYSPSAPMRDELFLDQPMFQFEWY